MISSAFMGIAYRDIEIKCKRPIKAGRLIYVGNDGYARLTKRGRPVGKAIEDAKSCGDEWSVMVKLY
jgi:hypothetical protein